MPAKQSFGKTWWGKSWVDAMERIDYNTNRLPRGKRYANNGSVLSIDIKDAVVSAKVQGSRPSPYKIKIRLKEFNKKQIENITEIISESPAIASEMSLGTLPENLLDILNEHKIHILPSSWKDINAECSCPDWANPCKHLAAVYYIIANEIDKNPFLIFNLRCIATETLIGAAGLKQEGLEDKTQKADVFTPYNKIVASEIKSSDPPTELPDLSFTPFDIESIFSLLPDNPLFYAHKDFKKTLCWTYKSVVNEINRIDIDENSKFSFNATDFYLIIENYTAKFFAAPSDSIPDNISGHSAVLKIPVLSNDKVILKKTKGRAFDLSKIIDLFLTLPLVHDDNGNSPSYRFLNISTSVALAFMRSQSFIPEIVTHSDNDFSIRYVPIIHDEKTQAAVNYLKSIMPFNICFRDYDNSLLTKDGISNFLSTIITSIFHRNAVLVKGDPPDKLYNAFFSNYIYTAKRFEEKQTAMAVANWLERLSIRKKDISPVIGIEITRHDKFAVRIDVENKKDPLSSVIPLSEVFDSEKIFLYPAEIIRTDVLRQISIAAEHMPKLKIIMNSKGREKAVIDALEMSDIISTASGIFNILGIKLTMPKEFKKLAMPTIAIKAGMKGKGEGVSYLSLDSLLDFSWEISIGDKTISKDDFLKLVKSAKGLVRFKDQYLLLNPEEVKKILERLNKPLPKLSSMDMLHAAFTGETEGYLFNYDEALKSFVENIIKPVDIDIPTTLNARLRPYQERGFRWLYSNTVKGFGSCIADDMGLGKTIQVITLILKLKEDKKLNNPVLVVCPTTLIGNWEKECEGFAPTLDVSIYHGTERNLHLKNKDIVITTYGILRRDINKFRDKQWELMVIDEAQNVKNPDTDQTKAVKSINARSFIAMSGTPVENRLTELWSIFDFINKGYLGHIGSFHRQYAMPIEKYRDKKRIERLRKAVSPFLLRRLKSDKSIISDLPDKVMFNEYCYLTKEQTAIYQQVVDSAMREIERSDGIERKGMIFKLITSLKQICNHPVHYAKKGKPLKELSGKAEKTIELIQKILDMKEKALIFTQYREMGDILAEMIRNEIGQDTMFFHGGIARVKRDKMVEDFQTRDSSRIMIVSLKAGGTGLNLTAATNVIHYDLWWNPAVEAQATDRAYRIGQDRNVMVHRLITLGTFEEKIDEMIKSKKELADLTITTGEQWITEMSDKELKEIFSLTKEAL